MSQELYELRCHVAHNTAFSTHDLRRVEELTALLKPAITAALEKLPQVTLTENEREATAEQFAKEALFGSEVRTELIAATFGLGVQKELIAAAVDRLPERERLIVALYLYEGLTMTEIGKILRLSQRRVDQLYTQAVIRMRGHLQRDTPLFTGENAVDFGSHYSEDSPVVP